MSPYGSKSRSSRLSKEELEKLGNTIAYMADRVSGLTKGKILKLVYLLDEFSIIKRGIPFFDLEYKVWKMGPVNTEIYYDLSEDPTLLKDYIYSVDEKPYPIFKSKTTFNDDEFSVSDIELLDYVIKEFGEWEVNTLVKYCHKEPTLWYKIAKEHDLLEPFRKDQQNSSEYVIDIGDYIRDENAKEFLCELRENKFFAKSLR